MKRRAFMETCGLLGTAASMAELVHVPVAWAQQAPRTYDRTSLVDVHGRPLRASELAADTNYVFQYPYASTPCLLLKLARPVGVLTPSSVSVAPAKTLRGGVGRTGNIVAFSAICAHKLAYPTREVSFIRYQRDPSPTSGGNVIHCCADHSVYDPAQGARVVSGPAPQPLAAILLDYDDAQDALYATGTAGPEQFEAFFDKYRTKLALEYGERKVRATVAATTVVRELANYCRTTIQC